NTSFQIHLRVDPADFVRVYNAVQLATAPALAVSGNSPTFLGHRLWEETRSRCTSSRSTIVQVVGHAASPQGQPWERVGYEAALLTCSPRAFASIGQCFRFSAVSAQVSGPNPTRRHLTNLGCTRARSGAGTGQFLIRRRAATCGSRCGHCPLGPF